MEVFATKKFKSQYENLSKDIRKKAEKQEKLFRKNQFHPSLHTEKLSPKSKEVWSFRVDKNYRVISRFINSDRVLFLNIGSHDYIYRVKS